MPGEREQFGRSISRFQAIQHYLAQMAAEVAAAGRAAQAAAAAAAGDLTDERFLLEVAAAKSRVGEAVGYVVETAHQIHGAMGYTYEHQLHHFTRRLWAWRDEYGASGTGRSCWVAISLPGVQTDCGTFLQPAADFPARPEAPLSIGISQCLLGTEVRYDGSGARSSFPHDALAGLFEYRGICPEVAIGMGVPREPIRLIADPAGPKAVGVKALPRRLH